MDKNKFISYAKSKKNIIAGIVGISMVIMGVFSVSTTEKVSLTTRYSVPQEYPTISEAIGAVSDGGTIVVSSGSYPLVTVNKNNIQIECIGVCQSKGFTVYGNNNSIIGFSISGAKQAGIYLFGAGHLVEGNNISGTTGDGDGIRAFGSGHIIRNNYIHDPNATAGAHIDCIQTWDETNSKAYISLSDFIFEGNVCSQVGNITAGMQFEGNVHDGIIRNNVITSLAGIRGYLESGHGTRAPHDLMIEHNVFVGSLSYSPSLAPVGVTISGSSNITFRNNIILEQPKYTFNIVGSNNTASNNLAYNSNNAMPPTPNMPLVLSLWGINPNLTSDYHPMAGSPVIGAASDGGDIGAFSFDIVPTITQTHISTNTPTKTSTQSPTPSCSAGSKNVDVWVQLRTNPETQTLRLRTDHIIANNIRGALYSDNGILWNVIEIWTGDCNTYWGKLGEQMWFVLKTGSIYFSNWRE